jgi:hypothetical protein
MAGGTLSGGGLEMRSEQPWEDSDHLPELHCRGGYRGSLGSTRMPIEADGGVESQKCQAGAPRI